MRAFLLSCFLVFTTAAQLGAQCVQPLSSGANTDWHALQALPGAPLWLAGAQGALRESPDEGNSWTAQDARTAQDLYGLYFTNSNTGWAVGAKGALRHTSNGGSIWSQQYSPQRSDLYAVAFSQNGSTGLIAGACGLLLRSTDNGTSWQQVASGATDNLYALTWLDNNTALAAGAGGFLLRSTDAGASWTTINGAGSGDWYALAAQDGTAWAAGSNGLYRSTDGGSSWEATALGQSLRGVAAINAAQAYAVGSGGRIYDIYDGGESFNDLSIPSVTEELLTVAFADSTLGYAAGRNGSLVEIRRFYAAAQAESPATGPGVADGSATVTAAGGTPPYALAWSDPTPGSSTLNSDGEELLSGLEAGDYSISITDATGCALERSFSIAEGGGGCNRTQDSLALVELYNATDGPNWTNTWNLATPIDGWHGVTLGGEGCVIELVLSSNGLSGTLPDLNLPNLQQFRCDENNLSGSIPDFSNTPGLLLFNCQNNNLSGQVPDFSSLPNLRFFRCGGNSLSGQIPDFANLPNLGLFICSANALSGQIPDFTSLPDLQNFFCEGNNLSGQIPDFSDNCPNLESLRLSENEFTFEGLLPHFIANQQLIDVNALSPNDIFIYAPQDSIFADTLIIRDPGSTLTIDLGIDEGISDNVYQWYKDGQPYTSITGNNKLEFTNLQFSDAGIYWVHITNPGAPDLTLESFPIELQVGDCEDVLDCNNQVTVNLDPGTCQAPLSADLLLEGTFDCLTPNDFTITVADGDPGNGAVVDGTGDFTYNISTDVNHPSIDFTDCSGTIIAEDNQAPAPVCISTSVVEVMPDAPGESSATVFAGDFVATPATDCSGPVTYSINRSGAPNAPGQSSLELNCSDVGTVTVEIWAYDAAGNGDFCGASIQVQDNLDNCSSGSATIAGTISMESGTPAACTPVGLSGSASATTEAYANGVYAFTSLPEGQSYTVAPYNNANPLNGISSLDKEGIENHILGLSTLTSPYQLIAADIDNNGEISNQDVIQLQKLLLGIYTTFPNNPSWRFVDATYTFPDPANPWSAPFPESVTIGNLPATGAFGVDFVAIKIGDVDLSATLPGDDCPNPASLALTVGEAVASPGENVCVPITAQQFQDVRSAQFTLDYNDNLLSYTGITNIHPNFTGFSESDVGVPTNGQLPVDWAEVGGNGVFLPDDAVLFEVCFDAVALGISPIGISNSFVPIEFINSNQELMSVNTTSGSIAIQEQTLALYFDAPATALQPGDAFCMSLRVDDFTDLTGMSFTVSYDASKLSYTGVSNLNGDLSGFNEAGNIGNPSPGFVTVNWVENSLTPITLPNGSAMLDLCFEATDCGASEIAVTSDVATLEFNDANDNVAPAVSTPANLVITEDLCRSASIALSTATVTVGESTCVSATVSGFQEVSSASLALSYDAQIVNFTGLSDLNLPGLNPGDFDATTPGSILLDWNPLTPATLTDGEVAFRLCFSGAEPGSSDVSITNPTVEDALHSLVDLSVTDGSITVNDLPAPGGLTLQAGGGSFSAGEPFCVPVTVDNFSDIVGMSFTVNYDTSLLVLESVDNVNTSLNGFSSNGNIGQLPGGFITVNWIDNTIQPNTLPSGATLFEACFRGKECGTTNLAVTSDVASIEFSNSNEELLPVDPIDAPIDITDCTPPEIASVTVTDVDCNGNATGSIDITVTGGIPPYQFLWSNGALTEDVSNLTVGIYAITVANATGSEPTTATFEVEAPAPITLDGSALPPSCAALSDGSLSLNIQGGTSPYTLNWNNGLPDDATEMDNLPAGTYCVTVTDDLGCSETTCLEVPQGTAPDVTTTISGTLCPDSSITVNGTLYDIDNPSGQELIGTSGCDSLVEIALSFYDIDTSFTTIQLCVGTSVTIGGILFNENNQMGTYFVEDDDTGCDQAETVIVDLLPVVRDSVVFDLCEGESVVYEGVTYDEANPSSSEIFPNYTANGCDSIFEVICHFRPNPTYVVNETLCPGEVLTINGTTFDESQPDGTMVLEGAGSNGCDSIIQVALDFHPPALANLQPTLCAGSSITVNGTVYSESNPSGTEIIPGAAPNGCDSIYQVDLTFYDEFVTELEEEICTGESYTVGGNSYAQTGNYVDTLIASQGGCDSIVQLNLTVLPNASGGSSVSVCESSLPYNWNGQSLSNSGTYIAELTASNGCDSTATLQLQVIPAIPTPSGLSSYVVCEGEPLPQLSVQPLAGLIINWYDAPTGGNLLASDSPVFTPSSTGSYYASAVAEGTGCESVERLAIEVEEQPAYFIQTPPVFTCTPSEAGMDTTYLISDSGCDSIVATQYILLPTPSPTEISITTCDEDLVGTDTLFLSTIFGCDSLVIRDISYQELDTTVIDAVTCDTESTGTFYFNFISVEGCDSIVQLNQSFDTTLISFATVETCDESLLGLDTIPLTTPGGCDSLAITEYIPAPVPQTAVDTLLCEGDELIFNGQSLSSEGIYYDTLQTVEGCDSIIALELLLLPPPEPTLVEDVLCEGTIYVIGDTTLTEPGMTDLVFTSAAGCDSMVTLILEGISAPRLSAVPDSYLYPQEEASIPINLVSNDTINGPGTWGLELLDLPAQGTLSVDSSGAGDYMLTNSAFAGIDSFRYEICPLDCPDSCSVAAVYVKILEDCEEAIVAEIPNAFTPDGDGINDYYDPLSDVSSNCLQNPQEAGMVIVNRWGEIVYEAEEYAPWDGRSMNSGKVVTQGYYHCILTFRFEEERVVRTPVHVIITQ